MLKQVKLVVGLDDRVSTRRKQSRLVGGQFTSLPFWQEQMVVCAVFREPNSGRFYAVLRESTA